MPGCRSANLTRACTLPPNARCSPGAHRFDRDGVRLRDRALRNCFCRSSRCELPGVLAMRNSGMSALFGVVLVGIGTAMVLTATVQHRKFRRDDFRRQIGRAPIPAIRCFSSAASWSRWPGSADGLPRRVRPIADTASSFKRRRPRTGRRRCRAWHANTGRFSHVPLAPAPPDQACSRLRSSTAS